MGHFISKGTSTRFRLNKKGEWELIFSFSHPKYGTVDYAKCNERGETYIRYVYFAQASGWLIQMPNVKYGSNIQPKETFHKLKKYNLKTKKWENDDFVFNFYINESTINELGKMRSDLKYIISKYLNNSPNVRKYGAYTRDVVKILRQAKEHNHDVEMLMSLRLTSLAADKMFWKMSEQKQKYIIDYIKQDIRHAHNCCAREYLMMANSGIKSIDKASSLLAYNCDEKLYNYITKNKISLETYNDYKKMVKQIGKNFNDTYWKFPKDFGKSHREVVAIIDKMKADSYFKFKDDTNKEIQVDKLLAEIYGENNKKKQVDNYIIYLCYDKEDIKKHASSLHQCILTNGYVKDMALKKTLLLFVKDSQNNPIATCEINQKKEIKQFYADEYDRNNCTPTQEVQDAMAKYLKTTSFKGVWS